jgi:hypothetical protein
MRRERLDGWPHRIVHLLALLAGWALFFYWWHEVAVQDWNRTQVALIIFVTLVVAPVLTIGWVMHNLSIFRRKGPRLGVPKVALEYPRDWNGREIVADWATLAESGRIEITVDGDRKLYTRIDPDAARER